MPALTGHPRGGVTLLELVAATAAALVVAGAAAHALLRQQRAYAGLAALLAAREQVAGALALVPADVRALSPASGDVTALGPDSLQLRATIGGGVACAAGGLTLDFPAAAAGEPPLAAWRAAPRAGDTALVYDPGDATRPPGWTQHAVSGFDAGTSSCAAAAPFVGAGGGGTPRARLRLDPAAPLPAHAGGGAAVRVLRHVRYKLYRAGDGAWYLGYTDYRAPGGWAVVQPVTGPHTRAAGAGGGPTPAFRYVDAAGTPVDDAGRASVAAVTLTIAGRGPGSTSAAASAMAADSTTAAARGPDR